MARLNVYVPDELAEAARSAELNVSAITQDALRSALDARSESDWLDSLDALDRAQITGVDTLRALTEARDELWGEA